jgi:ATP-dependent DNA ligase
MDTRNLQHPADLNWTCVAYPVAVEPKIDGCRCIATVGMDGTVRAYSRRNTEWTAIAPALADLSRFLGWTFDGEIQVGGAWGRTNGAIHRRVLSPAELATVVFHAFDLPTHPGTQTERRAVLVSMLADLPARSPIRIVPSVDCADERAVRAEFARVVANGGEGIVVKDPSARYMAGRGGAWSKLKPQITTDIRIFGTVVERGDGIVRVRHDRV